MAFRTSLGYKDHLSRHRDETQPKGRGTGAKNVARVPMDAFLDEIDVLGPFYAWGECSKCVTTKRRCTLMLQGGILSMHGSRLAYVVGGRGGIQTSKAEREGERTVPLPALLRHEHGMILDFHSADLKMHVCQSAAAPLAVLGGMRAAFTITY